MKSLLIQVAGVIMAVALCAWLSVTQRSCGQEVRRADGFTIETIDGHEYIRSHVNGGYTYTHSASCRYCTKGDRK